MKRPSLMDFLQALLFAFVIIGLGVLVFEGIVDKGVSIYNRILAVAIIVASAMAFLGASVAKDRKATKAKKQGGMIAVFGVFGVISGAIGLMAPKPVVEARPGLLQSMLSLVLDNVQRTRENTEVLLDGQAEIKAAVGAGLPSLIMQKIGKRWGESDCAVTYDLAIKDRALTMRSVKDASGMDPVHWVYTINSDGKQHSATGERVSIINATEDEGFFKGQSVTFRYATNGVTERLTRQGHDDKQNTMTLEPCN